MSKNPKCLYLASYPGGVKIGVARDPIKRLKGLNAEAFGRHKLEAVWFHSDPVELEDMVRDALNPHLSRGRERFAVSVAKAVAIIHDAADRYSRGERSVPVWKRRQLRISEVKRSARAHRDFALYGVGRTETRWNVKITPEVEAKMEREIAAGHTIREIAAKHKVAVATVRLRFNRHRLEEIRAKAARKRKR